MQFSDICIENLTEFDLSQLPELISSLKEEASVSEEPYIKKPLHTCDDKEIILTYWNPNKGSHIHNHGKSHGKVLIVEGEIIEHNYKFDGQEMKLLNDSTFSKKSCLDISPVNFHSMTSGDQPTITLHVYAPKIEHMCVYNESTHKLQHVEGDKTARCEHV